MQNIDLPFLVDLQMFHNFDYGNVLVSDLQNYWEPNSTYKPPYTKRYETFKTLKIYFLFLIFYNE